jgi:dihydropteroate synthase
MIKPFKFADRVLDLSVTQIMGVLNVTPDSFSDGGKYINPELALSRASDMCVQGATIIDVGGESTRPGAMPVSLQEEMDRVCPVVERIARSVDVVISVDTSRPEVMTESIRLGAGLINDVRAFTLPGALEAILQADVALCVMHMKGTPLTMQQQPDYQSVSQEVAGFLEKRAAEMEYAGVQSDRIIIDPGFGFGKTLEHNLQLLASIDQFCALGYPVLIGLSRKSMFATLLNREVDERLYGSIAAATIGASLGAQIIRVHDVQETADALKVVDAVKRLRHRILANAQDS